MVRGEKMGKRGEGRKVVFRMDLGATLRDRVRVRGKGVDRRTREKIAGASWAYFKAVFGEPGKKSGYPKRLDRPVAVASWFPFSEDGPHIDVRIDPKATPEEIAGAVDLLFPKATAHALAAFIEAEREKYLSRLKAHWSKGDRMARWFAFMLQQEWPGAPRISDADLVAITVEHLDGIGIDADAGSVKRTFYEWKRTFLEGNEPARILPRSTPFPKK